MAERPFTPEVDTEHAEQPHGPRTVSRHTGTCPICDWPYMAGRTPVTRTTWGRTVHPSCLAPPLGNPTHPRHRTPPPSNRTT